MPLITGTGKPRVILGTMTFGPDPESGARVTSLDEYKSCLQYFQSKGYNEIDTARAYIAGKGEGWTKQAGWKERGLSVATKHYPTQANHHTGENVEATLNKCLSELGTDCVDIFYLHAADRTLPFTEPLKKLDELHKKGKFVRLGLSNFTAAEVAEVVMHCKYNNWVRPVHNPVAGGIFSGKVKSNSSIPPTGRFSDTANSGANYRKRYFQDATFEALRLIEPVVEKHNLTLIETALRWVVHHSKLEIKSGDKDGIIIGVSSQAQLEGNLEALEKGPLPEEVVKVLDEAWLVTKATAVPYWHGTLEYDYDTVKALLEEPKL
ncbi:hypothetical protein M409DRAFT_27254 [Zasmidium cellare ATCC 36951]|uniref:NADP-dependent oxidoreductase domain-containing protein n=1 Tax=Zasmidium cellare ATCC 36951 TaxID=1080233 RepID=A0A6A6C7S1_ZASCE|nr:uncharacterized protein M409DRAFT_27254 [Zasmidium cellare ATCC 36951]KAF2162250.1 hypothetical protein M409DRAFT_27254 [Zasmidium cellare ATCC 36951]